jgi:hypothetical protein
MNATKEVAKTDNNVKTLAPAKVAKSAEETQKTAILETMKRFAPTQPTAEERIERIRHFDAMSERFKFLKSKANDLKMFNAGNDKTNAKIILKNANGFEFEVRNTNVIDKVTATMQTELNILLSDAESEILTFEI